MTYRVRLRRVETYFSVITVVSDKSKQEVADEVHERLQTEGWDAVNGSDDGDYESCESSVDDVEEVR